MGHAARLELRAADGQHDAGSQADDRVLSPAFSQSPYCQAEWAAAFAKDPTGTERRRVPVREFEPYGLLGQVGYVDVVGLSPEQARDVLLAGVSAGRGKPAVAPGFPSLEAGERVRGAAISGRGGRARAAPQAVAARDVGLSAHADGRPLTR